MPRILSQTPSWLSRPSPGYDLFSRRKAAKPIVSAGNAGEKPSCPRTIARRGTEIFVAVDRKVRWSDLTLLKEQWRQNPDVTSSAFDQEDTGTSNEQPPAYKVLDVSSPGRIRQLSISPRGNYLAIATSHGLRVAVLPAQSHLSSPDTGPIKLSNFQIGSTAHVVERSPLASVLWHPLGHQGDCLVTITTDAIVRLWELDRNSRGSFDSPSWAVDLKKLADGSSSKEDYTPSKYHANEGFSPDEVEMEVAASCFGGNGVPGQAAWASMTLWVAMKEGDIYALCPVLPSKFKLSDAHVSDLATSISTQHAADEADTQDSSLALEKSSQQVSWITEILDQQAVHEDQANSHRVYHRPSKPSTVPRLQGPCVIQPDCNKIFGITDIHTFPRSDGDGDMTQDSISDLDERIVNDCMPVDMLCVATNESKIHLFLQPDVPEGLWLPPLKSKKILQLSHSNRDVPELLCLESLEISQPIGNNQPMFSADVESSKNLFVTHASGVSHFSVSRWAEELATEASTDTNEGSEFRIDMMVNAFSTKPQQVLSLLAGNIHQCLKQHGEEIDEASGIPPACVAISDSALGSLIITTSPTSEEPQAVELDLFDPEGHLAIAFEMSEYDELAILVPPEVLRDIYQPPPEFYGKSNVGEVVDQQFGGLPLRTSRSYKEQVKMSDATLKLLMDSHRVLRAETHAIAFAAADLYRRCERLRSEFKEQIEKADKVARRTETILEDYADVYEERQGGIGEQHKTEHDDPRVASSASIERRLETAQERQDSILERYTALRRKIQSGILMQGRPINDREAVWMNEIGRMEDLIFGPEGSSVSIAEGNTESVTTNGIDHSPGAKNGRKDTHWGAEDTHKPWQRFENIGRLREQLATQSRGRIGQRRESLASREDGSTSNDWSPWKSRSNGRMRSEQVRAMLERESALVEAAVNKLTSLSIEVGG